MSPRQVRSLVIVEDHEGMRALLYGVCTVTELNTYQPLLVLPWLPIS